MFTLLKLHTYSTFQDIRTQTLSTSAIFTMVSQSHCINSGHWINGGHWIISLACLDVNTKSDLDRGKTLRNNEGQIAELYNSRLDHYILGVLKYVRNIEYTRDFFSHLVVVFGSSYEYSMYFDLRKFDDFCLYMLVLLQCSCSYIQVMSYSQIHIYNYIHAHTQAHSHRHARAHTCARTRTYMHECS